MGIELATAFGGGRAPMAIALTTGIVTAFNPCGFAMLPAYVSYFVGQSASAGPVRLSARLARAAATGLVVTAGFMTVFGALGFVASRVLSVVNETVPFISMAVGLVLAVLGIAMVRGFEPKLSFLRPSGSKRTTSLWSMFTYGVSYALVSISCGFAGFLTTVVSASQERSITSSIGVYGAFAAGIGLVLVVLSFAVAFAQQSFVRGMRRVLPYVTRVSGVTLLLAGLYVAYYGYYEWRTVLLGESAPAGPVVWVEHISAAVLRWADGLSGAVIGVAVAATAAAVVVSVLLSRQRDAAAGSAVGGSATSEPVVRDGQWEASPDSSVPTFQSSPTDPPSNSELQGAHP